MGGIRIRWRGVARAAAIVLVALIAVRLLPGFLRAPEPPPLGADVGLPKAAPVTDVARPRGGAAKRPRRHRSHKSHRRSVPDALASTAVIGSKRRHRVAPKPRPDPEKVVESAPSPPPEYVPPPAPEPVPEPLPEPPPAPRSTPDDGSEEFAPH